MSVWSRKSSASGRRMPTSGPAVPSPRVDRLLDSLRAPATSRELAREDHAVADFHHARLDTSPTRSHEMSPARTGLKAALASAAAVALLSTGAAFAASGHAPWAHAPVSVAGASADHSKPTHPTPSR